MDIQTWTFILVGLSFALYIGIAIWARAGSTRFPDYYWYIDASIPRSQSN